MLKVYNNKTNKEVNKGDAVTNFRGEIGIFQYATRAQSLNKSGKIVVDGIERYEGVYGLKVIEE